MSESRDRRELRHALMLLRREVEPDNLEGQRFDLSDCKEAHPIFAALAQPDPAERAGDVARAALRAWEEAEVAAPSERSLPSIVRGHAR